MLCVLWARTVLCPDQVLCAINSHFTYDSVKSMYQLKYAGNLVCADCVFYMIHLHSDAVRIFTLLLACFHVSINFAVSMRYVRANPTGNSNWMELGDAYSLIGVEHVVNIVIAIKGLAKVGKG